MPRAEVAAGARAAPRTSARRRAREFVLQGLYQWLLSGTEVAEIGRQLREQDEFSRADMAFADWLLAGAVEGAADASAMLEPLLDRPISALSPVERSILLLGVQELRTPAQAPFGAPLKVVINEAVELARRFGGTDGHKYVNGVLDRLARQLRGDERPDNRA